ncbi:MAG: hypothetical protein AB7G28_23980 [Pirellulales bacterium]
MNRLVWLVGVFLWLTAGVLDARTMRVDDFTAGPLVYNVPAGKHYPTNTQTPLDAEHVLGGIRISTFFAQTASGRSTIEVDTTGDGVLRFDGTNDTSFGEGISLQYGVSNVLVYPSLDNPLDLNLAPLASGAIELSFLSFEAPATTRPLGASVTLYSERADGRGYYSTVRFTTFPSSTTPFKVSFDLADFSGGVPLNDIDGMFVLIGPSRGARFVLDSISIVPEPGNMVLGATVFLLAAAVERCRTKTKYDTYPFG